MLGYPVLQGHGRVVQKSTVEPLCTQKDAQLHTHHTHTEAHLHTHTHDKLILMRFFSKDKILV